jgi:DNA-binding LacI/PurR family transcriptional regulator
MSSSTTTRPTLEIVARHAGVSRQTVSNALNAPHVVKAATLQRVRASIDELGYRPSSAARQLRTRRSRVLGLRLEPVQDGINGAVLDRFLHALTDSAQERGYRVMLFTAADDRQEIARYGELLDTDDLDAFVLTSTHRDDHRAAWLTEHGIPFVTFGRPWAAQDQGGHAWVDVDGRSGTQAAVAHLRELGHRRIAFLGWPEGSDLGADRAAGWLTGMADSGLSTRELQRLRVGVPDGVATGAQGTERLLADADPTAIVAASDSLALGALTVARRNRVAVVGFDDTPVAAAVGLSSVAQPLTAAAGAAVDLLLAQLGEGGPVPDRQVLLSPHLVRRATSTPPPAH